MSARRTTVLFAAGVVALALIPQTAAIADNPGRTAQGPTAAGPGWQRQFEQRFLAEADDDHPREWSRAMAEQVGRVGTEGNARTVAYAVQELRAAGLEVEVDEYSVYASRPVDISLRQTAPRRRDIASLEDVPAGTPNAEDLADAYNAYSPAGEVAGEVVYVNYGRPQDYAELEQQGVDLEGRIALARYGANFRGVKQDLAEEHGAAGMLIYSDPADDGFVKGPVYPEGPWRPADAIQRGSIQEIYRYPGDPLTPGEPSTPGTARIDPSEAENLPTLPTAPISYGEARPLLQALSGSRAPKEWQGGFDFPYRFGPGGSEVSMDLDIDYEQVPVRNVVARIPGTEHPGQHVLVGAHRDTWAYGARDNLSGWVSTMEIARSLAELYQDGWRPRRTIVLAGWDGEEYGLLGATEFAEARAERLRENAVAYVNMDGTAGSEFGAGAVPSLDRLLYAATRQVDNPSGEGSVYDAWAGQSDQRRRPAVERLGSGSDYTALLQHVGVASTDIGYSGDWGLYHSAYDNTRSIEEIVDPGYKSQTAAAEVSGLVALRLANKSVIPMRYSDYAQDTVQLLADLAPEAPEGTSLAEATGRAQEWLEATEALEARGRELRRGGVRPAERDELAAVNEAIMAQEDSLTQPEGIPSRPWFKHQVWAPGLTTGYAAQPLPALAEATEADDAQAFDEAADQLEESLRTATEAALAGAG
ncbi:MAG TPA: M28 family peptidase [Nocardioidaceae bacterium]|nr:M28 family peptidase [Nocardioidaceae bacterium]